MSTPLTLADWRVNEAAAIEREQRLRSEIRTLGGLVTGYSGGVDSTYLCVIAHQELGDRARAAIAVSPSLPNREWTDAVRMAAQHGFPVDILETEAGGGVAHDVFGPDFLYLKSAISPRHARRHPPKDPRA